MLDTPLSGGRRSESHEMLLGRMKSASCAWTSSSHSPLLLPSIREDRTGRQRRQENSGRQKGWKIRDTDKKEKKRRDGKLYLDNLIISHLQSTSTDAPSLHQAAHCEDRASGAGQPVDFPLSLSQRGPACPYISRSGHGDCRGHPSAAANPTTQRWPHPPPPRRIKHDAPMSVVGWFYRFQCRWKQSIPEVCPQMPAQFPTDWKTESERGSIIQLKDCTERCSTTSSALHGRALHIREAWRLKHTWAVSCAGRFINRRTRNKEMG